MRYAAMFHHFHDDVRHKKSQGSISIQHFQRILDYLEREYTLITPTLFLDKVESNTLEPKHICLTFDDALKSQVDIAGQELSKRGLRAFFFVYSGAFLENPPKLELYRDFRTHYFESVDQFYETFLGLVEKRFPLEYGEYLKNFTDDYLSEYRFYSRTDRKFRFLRDQILGSDRYCRMMDEMMSAEGYSNAERNAHLFMTAEDLKQLDACGHTVGLHSNSHPTAIDQLSYEDQEGEYKSNLDFVQSVTQSEVWAMSHPNGRYNKDTLKILNDMGIKVGFRSSLFPLEISSFLEIPREDHVNILKMVNRD